MPMNRFESLEAVRKELRVSQRMMVTHLNSATVAEAQNGMLFSTLHLRGHPFDTESNMQLNQLKGSWHRAISALDEHCAIHVTLHRKKSSGSLSGSFSNDYSMEVDRRYQKQFCSDSLFINDWYVTVIYQGLMVGKASKSFGLLKTISDQAMKQHREDKRKQHIHRLTTAISQLQASLAIFSPRLLGSEDEKLGHSELLGFLSVFINGGSLLKCHNQPVHSVAPDINMAKEAFNKYPRGHLGQFLSQKRIFFGSCVQFQGDSKEEVHYAAMISLKSYAEQSASIMLDPLLSLPCEFIQVNTFAPASKQAAQDRIKKHINKMQALNDPGASQIDQLHIARDELQSDRIKMGFHHNSLMVVAASVDILEKMVKKVIKIYLDAGMIAIRETLGQEAVFWAQIPTHFKYIARSSLVSSLNLVDFCPLHNYRTGYINANHLGSAMALAKTPSNSPLYFNFHAKGASDNPSPGHTVMIGGNGSGKTVAMCFSDSQLSRYGGRSVFFDRNRGCEIYIRACDGVYNVLHPSQAGDVSLNPFQMSHTVENSNFIKSWMKQLVIREDESEVDDITAREINDCVDYGFTHLSKEARCLSTVSQRLSLHFPRFDRLKRWLRGRDGAPDGEYAYLFDNQNDTLSIADKMGFDMTHFLDDEPQTILTAVTMYLFYRIEQSMDGRLMSIFMDEGWQYLNNVYWKNKLRRWLPTLRKLNAHIILATQSPKSVACSDIAHVILDNSATQIYFANPQAQQQYYVDGFNLTEAEFQCIKSLSPSSHLFLYKQAHQSCLCRFPLMGMEKDLMVFSATAESVRRCQVLRKRYGEHSSQWLLPFQRGQL